MTVTLDALADFTLEACAEVAWHGAAVALGPKAMAAMAEARTQFLRLIENPETVIYGVTSGYGQYAKLRFSAAERRAHAAKPPQHAAVAFGDPLPERVARAIVFARLANFVSGASAVSPGLAEAVAAMLNGGPLPKVPARGQGGAGEIVSLTPLFRAVAEAYPLAEKDSLALVNGSPAATALIADAAIAWARRLDLVADVLALSAEAFNMPLEHVDPVLEDYWNNPHDAWALQAIRERIGGGHGGARRPFQAPVSFRIMPRILGEAHRAHVEADSVARQSLAAVSDNPAVLPPSPGHPHGRAISTGGYHNAQAPAVMDRLSAASANLIVIAERMSAKLLDGDVSLLSPQLGGMAGLPYLGCLPMAIVGYSEEARMLATATLLPGSESGGFGKNEVASPVFLAWSKQERCAELLEAALASLVIVAARAYSVEKRPVPAALATLVADVNHEAHELDAEAEKIALRFRRRVYEESRPEFKPGGSR